MDHGLQPQASNAQGEQFASRRDKSGDGSERAFALHNERGAFALYEHVVAVLDDVLLRDPLLPEQIIADQLCALFIEPGIHIQPSASVHDPIPDAAIDIRPINIHALFP